jgi:two-component system cell cycle sensor histidine kinase PleC
VCDFMSARLDVHLSNNELTALGATVAMESVLGKEVWKTEFVTRISHEMRTPLTSIIGYAEVMLSDPKLPTEAKDEYVTIIRDAGKRLSKFLDAYIESEVIERNKKLVETRGEDVCILANRALQNVSEQAAQKSVAIEIRCEPAIFVHSAEPEHLVQILENLLRNSIEITPAGGRLEVRAVKEEHKIEIEVLCLDHGILSVSAAVVGRNFRWIQSPGIEIIHDGLGLAFAKHVVELEGGLLNIRTSDEGLSFTLQFPAKSKN